MKQKRKDQVQRDFRKGKNRTKARSGEGNSKCLESKKRNGKRYG